MTTASGPPLVLEYSTTSTTRVSWIQRLLLVLSLPSLAAPFLAFYWNVSPLQAVGELFTDDSIDVLPLALLGFGFFVAFPIVAWRAHLLWRTPGRRARRAYLAAALLAWADTVALNVLWCREVFQSVRETDWAAVTDSYPFLLAPPVAVVGFLIAWRLHARGRADRALTVFLTTPYLANAVICLVGFADGEPTLGYLLTLFVSVVWTCEVVVDVVRVSRHPHLR